MCDGLDRAVVHAVDECFFAFHGGEATFDFHWFNDVDGDPIQGEPCEGSQDGKIDRADDHSCGEAILEHPEGEFRNADERPAGPGEVWWVFGESRIVSQEGEATRNDDGSNHDDHPGICGLLIPLHGIFVELVKVEKLIAHSGFLYNRSGSDDGKREKPLGIYRFQDVKREGHLLCLLGAEARVQADDGLAIFELGKFARVEPG